MSSKGKTKGLGRGLEALFEDSDFSDLPDGTEDRRLDDMPIEKLRPGVYQPRTEMNSEGLAELAGSIREQGIINPIIVRSIGGDEYEIIAGERRYRAARQLGLETVPVIIREVDNQRALAMALIENIQREDLNPVEEAKGIERLIEEFQYTHEAAAEAIGRSRTATTNMLRLLQLTDQVKALLADGRLAMGHARALLAVEGADQILLAQEVVSKELSVRQTEDLIKKYKKRTTEKKKVVIKTRDDLRLEEALADTLGATVKLTANTKGKGKIVIEFANLDQLQGIVDHIQR